MRRILFVCLGNICRSPTAEGVVRARAAAAGLDLDLDSAGTGDWHLGHPPHPPAIAAAAARGYNLAPLRARQVAPDDFEAFDLILAMDASNRAALERLRPPGNETPVAMLLDHAAGQAGADLPDPYFTGDFEGVLDLVEEAADGLIDQLRRVQNSSAASPKAR